MYARRQSTYRHNITFLYLFQACFHLWFDGAVWVVYWQHRGLGLFEIGILEAILHVVSLCLDIPMGMIADRIGWKWTLSLSGFAGILSCLFVLLPHATLAGVLAFAFRGLQFTFANGSDSAITFETVKQAGMEDHYQRINGRMMAVQLIALGSAEALGGWIAQLNWTSLYLAFAMANALACIAAICLKPVRATEALQHSETQTHQGLIATTKSAVQFAKKNGAYRAWILYSAAVSGIISMFIFYGQSVLHDAGWSTSQIGLLTGFECVASAAASAISYRLTRYLGAPALSFICSIGMVLLGWLPGIGKGLGYLLTRISGSIVDPLVDKELNVLIPTSLRATLLSANSTAFSAIMVFFFPLFGAIMEHIGSLNAYKVMSALLLLPAGWLLLKAPRALRSSKANQAPQNETAPVMAEE